MTIFGSNLLIFIGYHSIFRCYYGIRPTTNLELVKCLKENQFVPCSNLARLSVLRWFQVMNSTIWQLVGLTFGKVPNVANGGAEMKRKLINSFANYHPFTVLICPYTYSFQLALPFCIYLIGARFCKGVKVCLGYRVATIYALNDLCAIDFI